MVEMLLFLLSGLAFCFPGNGGNISHYSLITFIFTGAMSMNQWINLQ